ncbi:MAG: RDD family protein [Actinomycetia bacterium]|nr:RDD family protein [Actinomycetes bacterium]
MTDREPENQNESTSDAEVPADLMPRFLARLIDGAILWFVFMILFVPIVFSLIFSGVSGFGGMFGGFSLSGIVIGIVWAAVIIGYFAFLESSRGQTIGKMIMKLKTEGPDGQNPTLEMAIKRNLFNALNIIPVLGGLLALGAVIYIAYTINESPTKTGWHDVFAGGTRVVKLS